LVSKKKKVHQKFKIVKNKDICVVLVVGWY